jgi:hypothetical protein
MAGKSTYLENKLLDYVLRGASFSSPSKIYIGLWTASLSDDADGSTSGEASGGNYSRASMSGSMWASAASGSISNNNGTKGSVTFNSATASWGTVTHFGLFDAATGGNLLYWAALSSSKKITSGTTPKFAQGTLTITED